MTTLLGPPKMASRFTRGGEMSKLTRLTQQPLAKAPFWLFLLVLWGVLEVAWRWRRARARI